MNKSEFKLQDGRTVRIEYTQKNGFTRYNVIIDDALHEKDVPCGHGWNQKTIEQEIREIYEKKEAEEPADQTKKTIDRCSAILERYDSKKSRDSRKIRRTEFQLEGLLGKAELQLMRKPENLSAFFKTATELETSMKQIRELAKKTENAMLKQRAKEMQTRYEQSAYMNY